MKRLLVAILLGGLTWSGYWFVAAQSLRSAYEGWFEARRAEGWQAEYTRLKIRGFPNRLDATFTDLSLADTQAGLAWEMPFFQILRLSYNKNHLIAVWPNEQYLSTPEGRTFLTTSNMRASLVMEDGTLPMRANLVASNPVLTTSGGGIWQAKDVQLALRARDEAGTAYQVAVTAADASPPQALQDILPASAMPESLAAISVDLLATFDRPWALPDATQTRPQPVAIDLTNAEITWGEIALRAAGNVTIDSTARPSGEVTLRAEQWQEMVDLARASGQAAPALIDTIESAFRLLSGLSGRADSLDIPLRFNGRTTSLGIVPIGPAPTIQLP